MRILAITHVDPWPPDNGGAARTHGVARALTRKHELHLLTLERPPGTAAANREDWEGLVVERFARPVPVAVTRLSRWLHSAAKQCPPFVLAEYSDALARRAAQLAATADAVVFLDDYASIYAPQINDVPVVLDKHNVFGASVGQRVPGQRRTAGDAAATLLMRRFERARVSRASAVIVTSEQESHRLHRLYGRHADAILVTGRDIPSRSFERGRALTPRVGWIGSLDWVGNTRGLSEFVSKAWHAVRADATLAVAGSGRSSALDPLLSQPRIDPVGYVREVWDFCATLDVAVVPLWQGPGIKVKTLTFLAFGLPVVTTPLGAEGMDVVDGVHCLIADTPMGLATAINRVLEDSTLAHRLGAAGRALVSNRYTWDVVGPQFVRVVESAAQHGHPRLNSRNASSS